MCYCQYSVEKQTYDSEALLWLWLEEKLKYWQKHSSLLSRTVMWYTGNRPRAGKTILWETELWCSLMAVCLGGSHSVEKADLNSSLLSDRPWWEPKWEKEVVLSIPVTSLRGRLMFWEAEGLLTREWNILSDDAFVLQQCNEVIPSVTALLWPCICGWSLFWADVMQRKLCNAIPAWLSWPLLKMLISVTSRNTDREEGNETLK
jgi:hypothetical protein